MAGKEDYRIFVGGLAWDVTERQLERTFGRFGKIIECQVRFFGCGEDSGYVLNFSLVFCPEFRRVNLEHTGKFTVYMQNLS